MPKIAALFATLRQSGNVLDLLGFTAIIIKPSEYPYLIERVPATGAGAVKSHLSRLRYRMRAATPEHAGGGTIETRLPTHVKE